MKLRELFELAGLRAKPRTYGHVVTTFDLSGYGTVRFAQWQHPKNRPTQLDDSQIAALRTILRPGDGVVDVGAHSGDTSVLFALAVGPEGRVFAVEPNRYVLPVLEANASLNPHAAPIEVLPYAATDRACSLTFDYSDAGFCNGGDLSRFGRLRSGHAYRLEVEGRNIPAEIADRWPEWRTQIRLLKTDTEGNDHAVVLSFASLIAEARPYILSEVFHRTEEAERRAFHQTLRELGYQIHEADPYRLLRGRRLSEDDMTRERQFDIFCVPEERA